MIFKPELARLVAKGKKTQTRRIINGKPCHYEVGHDYAVMPGRGQAQICRVTILDRRRERLGDVRYEDVLAEGFNTTADFARYWIRLHEDKRHDPTGLGADEVLEQWQERHGGRQVWVLTFELTRPLEVIVGESRSVYLTRANSGAGTTTDPRRKMPGEPEVLGSELPVGSHAVARARHEAEIARQQRLQCAFRVRELMRTARELAEDGGLECAGQVAELEAIVSDLKARLEAA